MNQGLLLWPEVGCWIVFALLTGNARPELFRFWWNENQAQGFCLTGFLYAKRYPLRSKTL